MRRLIGPVLVGLGVFLIVAAGLARFYAYPALAKTPTNYASTTLLEADGAEIFNSDPEVLESEVHDLAIESYTVADSGAEAPEGVDVWVNSTTVTRTVDGSVFQQTRERVAFDEVSGAADNCEECDTWEAVSAEEEAPVEREGQLYKFPFDTEKKDYLVWDGNVEEAVPATFEGEEELHGMTVYKFVQQIEPTVIETREVPGSVFGSDEPSVDADMVYGMTRTFYIEPTTGSPVDRVEERTQELSYNGVDVQAFTGTVQYTDEQVETSVDDVKTKATLLGALQLLAPLALLVIGLGALAAGLVLNRRNTRDDASVDKKDRPLVTA